MQLLGAKWSSRSSKLFFCRSEKEEEGVSMVRSISRENRAAGCNWTSACIEAGWLTNWPRCATRSVGEQRKLVMLNPRAPRLPRTTRYYFYSPCYTPRIHARVDLAMGSSSIQLFRWIRSWYSIRNIYSSAGIRLLFLVDVRISRRIEDSNFDKSFLPTKNTFG